MNECKKSKEALMHTINEISFAVNDMTLYLDTHPEDKKAMEFLRCKLQERIEAMKEYARYYGPLTIDTVDENGSCFWNWVMQPWPWE